MRKIEALIEAGKSEGKRTPKKSAYPPAHIKRGASERGGGGVPGSKEAATITAGYGATTPLIAAEQRRHGCESKVSERRRSGDGAGSNPKSVLH